MSKEGMNTVIDPKYSWHVTTLERIGNDVFFKQEHEIVSKRTDEAFLCLLCSEACEDNDVRNEVIDSWFSVRKTQTIIHLKELPENVLELVITIDI